MTDDNAVLTACDLHTDENCLLFTANPDDFDPYGHDDDGNVLLRCSECLTAEEEADARAEFGDAVWDSLA
jgi:hypothetical protein